MLFCPGSARALACAALVLSVGCVADVGSDAASNRAAQQIQLPSFSTPISGVVTLADMRTHGQEASAAIMPSFAAATTKQFETWSNSYGGYPFGLLFTVTYLSEFGNLYTHLGGDEVTIDRVRSATIEAFVRNFFHYMNVDGRLTVTAAKLHVWLSSRQGFHHGQGALAQLGKIMDKDGHITDFLGHDLFGELRAAYDYDRYRQDEINGDAYDQPAEWANYGEEWKWQRLWHMALVDSPPLSVLLRLCSPSTAGGFLINYFAVLSLRQTEAAHLQNILPSFSGRYYPVPGTSYYAADHELDSDLKDLFVTDCDYDVLRAPESYPPHRSVWNSVTLGTGGGVSAAPACVNDISIDGDWDPIAAATCSFTSAEQVSIVEFKEGSWMPQAVEGEIFLCLYPGNYSVSYEEQNLGSYQVSPPPYAPLAGTTLPLAARKLGTQVYANDVLCTPGVSGCDQTQTRTVKVRGSAPWRVIACTPYCTEGQLRRLCHEADSSGEKLP